MKFNENLSRLEFKNLIKDLIRQIKLLRERKQKLKWGNKNSHLKPHNIKQNEIKLFT